MKENKKKTVEEEIEYTHTKISVWSLYWLKFPKVSNQDDLSNLSKKTDYSPKIVKALIIKHSTK